MFHLLRPQLRAPILGAGLGAWVGLIESFAVLLDGRVHLGRLDAAAFGVGAVLVGAVTGLAAGLFAAAVLLVPVRYPILERRHALGMALSTFALGALHLWPLAWAKWVQGVGLPSAVFVLFPLGFSGVVYFNARYWLTREALGERRRVGFVRGSLLLAAALGAAGGLVGGGGRYGSARAVAGDASALLVLVEGPALAGPLPRLEALAEGGVRFTGLVAPVPAREGALAALFTGRHPLRSAEPGVGGAWRLPKGQDTLAEALAAEGYATGAFWSTADAGADRGFAQGFEIYDDESLPLPAGLGQLRVLRWAARAGGPWRAEGRSAAGTVERAQAWMGAVGARPALAVVHLAGADAAAMDAALSALLGAATGQPWLVAVVGVAGDGGGGGGPLDEAALRVPAVLVAPGALHASTRVVGQALRQFDVPAAILDRLSMDPMPHAEGVDLFGYAEGVRQQDLPTLLAAPAAGVFGYRAPTADGAGLVKLVWDTSTDARHLCDLRSDPACATDLAPAQTAATEATVQRIRSEAEAWLSAGP